MEFVVDKWNPLEIMIEADAQRGKQMKRRHIRIPAEEFVRVWQQSASMKTVATVFGVSLQAVAGRACRYREMGIPLKKFKKGPKVNTEALKSLVEELNGQEQ